jgi:hypothetical protein
MPFLAHPRQRFGVGFYNDFPFDVQIFAHVANIFVIVARCQLPESSNSWRGPSELSRIEFLDLHAAAAQSYSERESSYAE